MFIVKKYYVFYKKIARSNDTIQTVLSHIILIRFVKFYLKSVKITNSWIFIVIC